MRKISSPLSCSAARLEFFKCLNEKKLHKKIGNWCICGVECVGSNGCLQVTANGAHSVHQRVVNWILMNYLAPADMGTPSPVQSSSTAQTGVESHQPLPRPTHQVGSNLKVITWLPQLLTSHLAAGATLPWRVSLIHTIFPEDDACQDAPRRGPSVFPTKARSLVFLWARHLFKESCLLTFKLQEFTTILFSKKES